MKLASAAITRVRRILQDQDADPALQRWLDAELLDWLNDAMRDVVMLRPEAYIVAESVALAAGTAQAIPAGGITFISAIRNMGVDGQTPGRAVSMVNKNTMDTAWPTWHEDDPVAEVTRYMVDDRDPHRFFVYPPSDGTGHLAISYSASPEDVAVTGEIPLNDVYFNALVDYVCYRAYLKEVESTSQPNLASQYYTAYLKSLGLKKESDDEVDPNKANTPQIAAVRQ